MVSLFLSLPLSLSLSLFFSLPHLSLTHGGIHTIMKPPVKWWTLSFIKQAVSAKRGRRNPDKVGMW